MRLFKYTLFLRET